MLSNAAFIDGITSFCRLIYNIDTMLSLDCSNLTVLCVYMVELLYHRATLWTRAFADCKCAECDFKTSNFVHWSIPALRLMHLSSVQIARLMIPF